MVASCLIPRLEVGNERSKGTTNIIKVLSFRGPSPSSLWDFFSFCSLQYEKQHHHQQKHHNTLFPLIHSTNSPPLNLHKSQIEQKPKIRTHTLRTTDSHLSIIKITYHHLHLPPIPSFITTDVAKHPNSSS